ncbi:hypothetical protein KIK06_09900 [Nocardiopsis sp. EMB25]|uniref:hypothetical protein n=1 Tax=Nocardiopsis sp. EMB25 TaxID=2835867 RepID=UPI002283AEAD|nr:hypothetical protein [Nocardiopsis sp. EMB25]MCY9784205.1 hypothetical protein [Nocardiopsis sp. EMB25]
MSAPLELATAAASSIVGAMATTAWTDIRESCVALFHRYLDGEAQTAAVTRLDTHHQALAATPDDARDGMTGIFAEHTAQDLAALLERSPEAAGQLRSLLEEVRSASASEVSVISHNRVENVKAKGDVIVTGRDANVRKGK